MRFFLSFLELSKTGMKVEGAGAAIYFFSVKVLEGTGRRHRRTKDMQGFQVKFGGERGVLGCMQAC